MMEYSRNSRRKSYSSGTESLIDFDDEINVEIDLSAIDFKDLEEQYHVPPDEGLEKLILCDGLPKIGQDKYDALTKVLQEHLLEKVKDGIVGFEMPLDNSVEPAISKGYAMIEFCTPEQSHKAVTLLNGRALDKMHTLFACLFKDIERTLNTPDEFQPPEKKNFKENEHLKHWLLDFNGRDQWVIYHGDEVTIQWNKKSNAPEEVISRHKWTETFVQWSPFGTFLCSMHRQGLQLWGGKSWNRVTRFLHPSVDRISFSPNENYVVTWSHEPLLLPPLGHPARDTMPFSQYDEGKHAIIWCVKTGQIARSFLVPTSDLGPQSIDWPIFKWSFDDKYVARLNHGQSISVYEAPSMVLIDKKKIKIDKVEEFEWCPSLIDGEHHLSYWTPEAENQPARVVILSIPNKEIIRAKNLFNISDCKMHWQSKGDFLCVRAFRHNKANAKSKKVSSSNLEIFRMRDKNIPVEIVEVGSAIVTKFAWEPNGKRFAILTTNDSNYGQSNSNYKCDLAIYGVELSTSVETITNFKEIFSSLKKNLNSLFWNPKGRFLLASQIGGLTSSEAELYDLDYETEKNETAKSPQLIATIEFYGVTDVEWDLSGRYILGTSSSWRHRIENGYKLWDIRGQLLRTEQIDGFKQMFWRPRPPTLLTAEQIKATRKNLRDYAKMFEQEDMIQRSTADREIVESRQRLVAEWLAWRDIKEKALQEERKRLGWTPVEEDNSEEYIEELIEQVISEEIVPM